MATIYYAATSIDGYIADADNSLSWLFQFGDIEGTGAEMDEFMAGVGALVMGSTTYAWLYDELKLGEDPAAWPYPQPTWIFTHRDLPQIPGADLHFVSGDVVPVHQQMTEAAAGKNLWVVGGGELAGLFHDAGLLDELVLSIAAVTLGSGAPLLPRRITTPPLRLVEVRQYPGQSFVTLRYLVQQGDVPDRDHQQP